MYSFLEPLLPYKWKHLPRFRACHSFRRINSGIRDCHSSRRIKIINGGAVGERSTAQIDTRNIRFRWCFINSTYIHTRAVGRACAYSRQKNVYRWQIDRRFVAFHFVLSGFAEQKLLSSRVSSFYRATAIDPGIVESQSVDTMDERSRGFSKFASVRRVKPERSIWRQREEPDPRTVVFRACILCFPTNSTFATDIDALYFRFSSHSLISVPSCSPSFAPLITATYI